MNDKKQSLASGLQFVGMIQMILFGCAWAGFGIVAFFIIDNWGREYARKMELVSSGKVPPQKLFVNSIREDPQNHEWDIRLSPVRGERDPSKMPIFKKVRALEDLTLGYAVRGYRIDNEWFVPRFYTGGWEWGKWLFLAVGVVPPVTVAGIALLIRARRKKKSTGALVPPKGATQLPAAFSAERMHISTMPREEELLAILGSSHYTNHWKIVETPTIFSARPGAIPMQFVVPWMLFVAILITASPWIVGRFGIHATADAVFWGVMAIMWTAVLPAMVGIFTMLNRQSAGQPDFFVADLRARTLFLPRAGVTIPMAQIEFFTLVKRWCRSSYGTEGWTYISHTGVLVRDERGEFDYFAVLLDPENQLGKKTVSDRLAAALGVPVKRITRTLRESKTLSDHAS